MSTLTIVTIVSCALTLIFGFLWCMFDLPWIRLISQISLLVGLLSTTREVYVAGSQLANNPTAEHDTTSVLICIIAIGVTVIASILMIVFEEKIYNYEFPWDKKKKEKNNDSKRH